MNRRTQTKLRLMQGHNTLMRSRNNWMNDWAARKAGISLISWRGVCTRVPWQWIFSWGPVSVFSWRILVSSRRPSVIHHKLHYERSNHSVIGAQQVRNSFNNLWAFTTPIFRHFRRQFWMSHIVTSHFFLKNHNEQAHTDQTTTNAGS